MLKKKVLIRARECNAEVELRNDMVEYIQFRMNQLLNVSSTAGATATSPMKQLSEKESFILAKLIEAHFFEQAKTREEYTKLPDAGDKVKSAAISILRKQLEKRVRRIKGFRSNFTIKRVAAAQTA